MSIAERPAMTPEQSEHWHEGYRTGRRAAAFAVRTLERAAENAAARATLSAAAADIDAIATPECTVVVPAMERLLGTMRVAAALCREGLASQAQAILEDALR